MRRHTCCGKAAFNKVTVFFTKPHRNTTAGVSKKNHLSPQGSCLRHKEHISRAVGVSGRLCLPRSHTSADFPHGKHPFITRGRRTETTPHRIRRQPRPTGPTATSDGPTRCSTSPVIVPPSSTTCCGLMTEADNADRWMIPGSSSGIFSSHSSRAARHQPAKNNSGVVRHRSPRQTCFPDPGYRPIRASASGTKHGVGGRLSNSPPCTP